MALRYSSVASPKATNPAVKPAKEKPARAAPAFPMFLTTLVKPVCTVLENRMAELAHLSMARFCSLVTFPAFTNLEVN